MSDMQFAAIVAIGEPMVEFNQARADEPASWLQGFGDDTSIMVIAAARLGRDAGLTAGYVTRIGNDMLRCALVLHVSGIRQAISESACDASFAAIDATGAGDCFDGAFAVRMLAGNDPFRAARYANVAAAIATTGFGAVAPLPDADAVRAYAAREGALA